MLTFKMEAVTFLDKMTNQWFPVDLELQSTH